MKPFDFNKKKFSLIENTESGKVNSDTVFEFYQKDDLVTANYFGGTIKYGKIIALLNGNKLNMIYQCVTTDNELKAGKAIADISLNENEKIKLNLRWEWLNKANEKGTSEYLEI
nr:hypothetical protein [uncultured Marinifilum sp.]